MDIEAIRLDMPLVTSGNIRGKVVAISKEGGLWLETADRTRFPVHVECVKPVREHVFYRDGSCDYDLCNGWAVARAVMTGGDVLPLSEVAKCYKQVEPDQLLMSQEARRVIEYLKARDCPISIHHMFESMKDVMSGAAIMDGLIEAREAGIVRLDDGKYSIVRD